MANGMAERIGRIAARIPLGGVLVQPDERLADDQERRDLQQRLSASGIPARYRGAAETVGTLPAESENGYRLHGPTGCGKSFLAAALLERAIRSGASGRWISVPLLIERLKSASRPNGNETTYQIIKSFRDVGWLVIDDLGKERSHDWDRTLITTLVWQAYDHAQRMIVTTNLRIQDIHASDEALASRVATLEKVEMPEVDYRVQPGNGKGSA